MSRSKGNYIVIVKGKAWEAVYLNGEKVCHGSNILLDKFYSVIGSRKIQSIKQIPGEEFPEKLKDILG